MHKTANKLYTSHEILRFFPMIYDMILHINVIYFA